MLKNANFLDLNPLARHRHEIQDDGMVKVLIPKFSGFPLGTFLQPRLKHPWMTISLDEHGTATWLLCNGNNQVRNICQSLRERFGKGIEPAEERVTTFLSQLYKQKLITFKEILTQ